MHKKTLIPYLIGDYNKILEDFQIEKIRSMEKDELIYELKDSNSWIYDFYLKKKSINLFLSTSGFLNFGLTIDDLYKIGVETTIKQLNKRYFFDIQNDCNLNIIKKIKNRNTNNMRNYFSPTRRINYQQYWNLIVQIEDSYDSFEQIVCEIELEKIDREILKKGLRKVWDDSIGDMNFDLQDFQDLCGKYGFAPIDILLYDPWVVPQMSKEFCNNSNYQLVLVFDDGEIA